MGKALSANYEISFIDTTNNKVYKEINEAFGDMFTVLERISKAKVMITDRLHGMIFSYITGTPCIVLPCSGPKIEYSYRFIKNCEYIRFCPSFDIDSIIKELDSLPIDKQWKPDDLSESYQDFKKRYLYNNETEEQFEKLRKEVDWEATKSFMSTEKDFQDKIEALSHYSPFYNIEVK